MCAVHRCLSVRNGISLTSFINQTRAPRGLGRGHLPWVTQTTAVSSAAKQRFKPNLKSHEATSGVTPICGNPSTHQAAQTFLSQLPSPPPRLRGVLRKQVTFGAAVAFPHAAPAIRAHAFPFGKPQRFVFEHWVPGLLWRSSLEGCVAAGSRVTGRHTLHKAGWGSGCCLLQGTRDRSRTLGIFSQMQLLFVGRPSVSCCLAAGSCPLSKAALQGRLCFTRFGESARGLMRTVADTSVQRGKEAQTEVANEWQAGHARTQTGSGSNSEPVTSAAQLPPATHRWGSDMSAST